MKKEFNYKRAMTVYYTLICTVVSTLAAGIFWGGALIINAMGGCSIQFGIVWGALMFVTVMFAVCYILMLMFELLIYGKNNIKTGACMFVKRLGLR